MNETSLIERYSKSKCSNSLCELINTYLPLIKGIAKKYWASGEKEDELINEGILGFCQAIIGYREEKSSTNLGSYAHPFIKKAISEFIIANGRIVRIITTPSQKKALNNLRKMTSSLGFMCKSEIDSIAKELDIKSDDVRLAESFMTGRDISYHCSDNQCDLDSELKWINWEALSDEGGIDTLIEMNFDLARSSALEKSLLTLNERERFIIQSRWLNDSKSTLKSLSEELGVSIERVRQLEDQAIKRIKESVVLWLESSLI